MASVRMRYACHAPKRGVRNEAARRIERGEFDPETERAEASCQPSPGMTPTRTGDPRDP
jgi:hypothetical protein